MICEKCGCDIPIGAWPFCPHGTSATYTNVRDDIPGGMVLENYGPEPVTVYSHSERRKLLKQRGLEEAAHHVPGDKHVRTWDTVDPVTVANAQTMLERIHHVTPHPGPLPAGEEVAVSFFSELLDDAEVIELDAAIRDIDRNYFPPDTPGEEQYE